jgi:hypothetical protein
MVQKLRIQALVTSASIASVLAVSFAAIPKADANTTGCASAFGGHGSSCVLVNGNGLRVNYLQGGVYVGRTNSVFGHMEIWGSGFHVNTSDKTLRNNSRGTAIVWDPERVSLNRDLPNGSQVCSRFWRKIGSSYNDGGIACKTIER